MNWDGIREALEDLNKEAPKPPERPRKDRAVAEVDFPVTRYILSLRRGDPIRELAESILAGRPPVRVDSMQLIAAVTACTFQAWKRGVLAAWCIGRLPISAEDRKLAVDRLSWVLENKAPQDYFGAAVDKLLRITGVITFFALLAGVVFSIPYWLTYPAQTMAGAAGLAVLLLFGFLFFSAFVIGPVVVPLSIAADRGRMQRLRAQVAESLGILRAPESVDALTTASLEVVSRVREPAVAALMKVLPTVTEENPGRLSAHTQAGLFKLMYDCNRDDCLAILRALGRVGSGRAAASLESLMLRWQDGAVRREAERILPLLRERQRQDEAATVLLRAAECRVDALLRPAQGGTAVNPEQMLRPADSGGG